MSDNGKFRGWIGGKFYYALTALAFELKIMAVARELKNQRHTYSVSLLIQ